MVKPSVLLDIGELRLTGFEPHGRGELHDLIVQEVADLITANPSPWTTAQTLDIDRLDLGLVKPGTTRRQTAARIAQGIHRQLLRQTGPSKRDRG